MDTLGIVDYGIYNVVGGIVAMLSFLSGTLASASQRFFAFELGRNNYIYLKQIFNVVFIIYLGIAILVLLLAETVGLWFLNTKMTIPPERISAANLVYQFSIFSFVIIILTIPYNSAIIAHEKMNVYAYVSILEVILKLLAVYLLVLFSYDKLELYAILTFCVTLIVTFIYRIYCQRKFEECNLTFYWNKKMSISLLSYSGWNIIGSVAIILRSQGLNIILNIFWGPLLNAAYAISSQIQGVLSQFITSIYSSTRPQIVKYYSQNEMQSMWSLVFDSTKFSYYLFLILSIPLFFEVEYILTLWLGRIPEYTCLIVRLVLVGFMLEIMSNQLVAVLQAANKLKKFQTISSSILLLNLPLAYIVLKLGASPYMPFGISIVVTILYMISQIYITKQEINFPLKDYMRGLAKIILVSILSTIVPFILHNLMNEGLLRFICVLVLSTSFSILFIWIVDINSTEKKIIKRFTINKLYKFFKI